MTFLALTFGTAYAYFVVYDKQLYFLINSKLGMVFIMYKLA